MEHLKSVLHEVVKSNTDDELQSFYVDPRNNVALAGHRRSYNVGDLVVRYQGPVDPSRSIIRGGVWHYTTETFMETPGLPASRLPDGGRQFLDSDSAYELFNREFERVNGAFTVLLNPKTILDFIEARTQKTGFSNAKINIEVFDGMNDKGHLPARAVRNQQSQGRGFLMEIRTPRGTMYCEVENTSMARMKDVMREGEWYIIAPIGVVEGRRIVKVLRPFKRGVRMAIQRFNSGVLMINQPRYSVISGEDDNSILPADVMDLGFLEDQQHIESNFAAAPMITMDLDTLYRALSPLAMYKKVEMKYKETYKNAMFISVPEEGQPFMDCIASLTSPYKNGKVCTE